MSWESMWVGFAVSVMLGLVATRLSMACARRFGVMNYPNGIVPQHKIAVAYLGGFGVALGAFAALGVFQILTVLGWVPVDRLRQFPWGLTIGSALFLVLGLYDDLSVLRPAPKLALQLFAACAAMLAGTTPRLTGNAICDLALSCAWIVVVVNAVNVTDVCDGLVAGLSLLAFLFLSCLGPEHRFVDIILAGACLGFLVFNRPPARIFLGDAGSHLLGFLLAFLTLREVSTHARMSAYAAMILVAGVPLFEMTFLATVRTRKHLPFWQGSPDHFSLRLQAAGFSRGQTDLIAWSVMVLLCGFAWALLLDPPWPQQAVLITAPVLLLAVCWRLLLRYNVRGGTRQVASSS
jgi:UDP-GlcNAc:undecaprenyl-phosphate GlcNAc-1-phosphate transferase